MKHLRSVLLAALLPAAVATLPQAETLVIEAGRDTTLIEDPAGQRANGAGPAIFSGRTSQERNSVRRALLWFDVAAVLPEDAVIQDVTLVLTTDSGNPSVATLRLHRVLADWGEGGSSASGGSGAPAQPGDATWLHSFYDNQLWARPGGLFMGHESASLLVPGSGVYSWSGAPGLVRDVRLWLTAPQRNFGWVLMGDETARQTAKRFASRDASDPAVRPVLVITFSRRSEIRDSRSPTR